MVTSTSPLRYLVHGTSKIALLRLVGLGLSFALSVTLARWLSAADFGTYKYILSWAGLGAIHIRRFLAANLDMDEIAIQNVGARSLSNRRTG